MLCMAVVLGTVACGTGNNANDDAANDTNTESNNNGSGNAIDDIGNTARRKSSPQ